MIEIRSYQEYCIIVYYIYHSILYHIHDIHDIHDIMIQYSILRIARTVVSNRHIQALEYSSGCQIPRSQDVIVEWSTIKNSTGGSFIEQTFSDTCQGMRAMQR